MASDSKDENSLGKMVVFAAFLLALGTIVGAYLLAQGDYAPKVNVGNVNENQNTISVSASATQKVKPDLLLMQLRVQSEAKDAKTAQQDNAAVENKLLARLRALGINDEDIRTTYYNIQPVSESEYVCPKPSPAEDNPPCTYKYKVVGYRAVQGYEISVKDLSKGGSVIDQATSVGTNQSFVDGVSFTLQDSTREQIIKSLLKTASGSAKAKAQNIADGLGASLGKVTSASESGSYYPQPLYYAKDYLSSPEGAAPTPLSPGQVDVSASVSVSYEIK
ncbi:SIMPL domain-containing protein [Candidatus Micrarchaeota archaeon]|nr:SIMPL domain-containing protein [Candidatus Micrarchaeota archaeon]